MSGLVELIGGIRWQYLLYVQDIRLPWWRVLALMIIGVFFNVVAPGGTGGDLVKTFYLMKETPGKRTLALLSVIMDRILGLLSVVILAAIFITVRWIGSLPRSRRDNSCTPPSRFCPAQCC